MGTGFAHGIWIRDVGVVPNAWGRPEVIWSERGRACARKLGIGEGPRHAHRRGGAHRRGRRARCAEKKRARDWHERARIRHRDRAGRRVRAAPVRAGRARRQAGRLRHAGEAREERAAISCRSSSSASSRSRSRCARATASGSGRSATNAPEARAGAALLRRHRAYTPDLVTWNGGGFDLPVLHYRALRHGIVHRATGKSATTTRRSATTTTSAAITGGTSTSWTCCRAYQARARVA